jgi:hypothetical protein
MALTPDQRFRFVNDHAEDHGYFAGFPNFHEADYGQGLVGGVFLLRDTVAEWRDVPRTTYGVYRIEDVPALFRAANDYAGAEGYSAAFPNCHQADHGQGVVYGTILIKPNVTEWRDVPGSQLGNPATDDVRAMMTAAADYATANGFVAGFPTFHQNVVGGQVVYGIVLFPQGTAEWRDVPIDDLYLLAPREEKTCVILCRFRDDAGNLTDVPAQPDFYHRYFFEDGRGERGLYDYYREVTHGRVKLVGEVFGWLDIGHTLTEHTSMGGQAQRRQAYDWAIAAARANAVPVAEYPRRAVIINAPTDFGGIRGGILMGHSAEAALHHAFMQHEVGHLLGLDDSFGPPSDGFPDGRYKDDYCVMSVATTPYEFSTTILGVTNAAGPGLNAVYVNRLGGLPPRRVVDLPASGAAATAWLAPLGRPDKDGLLAVRVLPNGDRTNTYWVEYRHPSKWDTGIGTPSVVLHEARPGDGRSFLIPGPSALALRNPGDEICTPDFSFVIQLKAIASDQLTAEVRMWALGPDGRREVRIRELVSGGPGDDLDQERVVLRNDRPRAVNLDRWRLQDSRSHSKSSPFEFRFPAFVLAPGEDVILWTKTGVNDSQNLFWNRGTPVWNNIGGDTAILLDSNGAEVSRFSYS